MLCNKQTDFIERTQNGLQSEIKPVIYIYQRHVLFVLPYGVTVSDYVATSILLTTFVVLQNVLIQLMDCNSWQFFEPNNTLGSEENGCNCTEDISKYILLFHYQYQYVMAWCQRCGKPFPEPVIVTKIHDVMWYAITSLYLELFTDTTYQSYVGRKQTKQTNFTWWFWDLPWLCSLLLILKQQGMQHIYANQRLEPRIVIIDLHTSNELFQT